MATLQEIVVEINRRAAARPLGEIQDLRKQALGLVRKPARTVFGNAREGSWTHHIGGREELQFNLGIESPFGSKGDFRFGVAFSFETSRSLPTIDPLVPKVARFNEYLRQNAEDLAGLWMWHHANGQRSELTRPTAIEPSLVRPGVFVFLGDLGNSSSPNYEAVLDTLDRLLPLYRFVEATSADLAGFAVTERAFRPSRPDRTIFTTATLTERTLDVELRHNALQAQLYDELVDEFGEANVEAERPAPGGGKIDLEVRTATMRLLFEIKTASTARGCIREALGQLLDYACWPGGTPVDQAIVAGEPLLTPTEERYLHRLNSSFPVPLSYRRISLTS